jgi:flagellar basal body rod protein FlgG
MIGFSISVSGIRAGIRRLDVAAHNLSNATTPGFKASRFKGAVQVNFSQGPLEPADGRFALGIEGDGFFRVGDRFTRAGLFHVDAAGNLVNSDGLPLQPGFAIPAEATSVQVSPQGQVSALMADGTIQNLGTIELVRFANPNGLAQEGGTLLAAGPASGPPTPATGKIIFGTLEGSNVDLAGEMVSLIVSRAFVKANIAALKSQDEALGEIIDLRS